MTHEGTQQHGLSRRDLLMRGATVVGSAAVASAIPFSGALGARSQPESAVAALTAEQRLAQLRESARIELPRIEPGTWEPKEKFIPGDVIYSTKETEKVLRLRIDDFWWRDEFAGMIDELERLRVPATLNPVGAAVDVFPDIVRRADALLKNGDRLVEWQNHTDDHSNLDQIPKSAVIDHILPQNHSLEDVLRRPIRQKVIAPPGGAGAELGKPVDPELKEAAKRLNLGILMWNKDTRVWAGASVEEAIDNVYPFRRGDIIILHGLANDRLALPEIVRLARRDRFRFEHMSSISITGTGL